MNPPKTHADELKAIDAELAKQCRSTAIELARLRELTWMFVASLLLILPILAAAFFVNEVELSSVLSTYAASIAIGIAGWGLFRSILGCRSGELRALFVLGAIAFGLILCIHIHFLLDARSGDFYFNFHHGQTCLRR